MTSERYRELIELRSDRVDEFNFEINQRIKKVEGEIKAIESEIILAALNKDWFHEAELMKLVDKKENKIERLKTQLING